jgi:hypothetical protein
MTPRKPRHLRTCARCEAPIAEQRPVFLVATGAGRIVGPYHAGCAERIHLAKRGTRRAELLQNAATLGHWESLAEERNPS